MDGDGTIDTKSGDGGKTADDAANSKDPGSAVSLGSSGLYPLALSALLAAIALF